MSEVRERLYVEFRQTDGAHATAWLVRDRQARWWWVVSQHRTEKGAFARARRLNRQHAAK